jgi:hypothetical protein
MIIARPLDAATQLPSPQPGLDVCTPELARHWLRRGIRRRDAVGVALRQVDPLVDLASSTGLPVMPIDQPVIRHLAAALDGFRGMDALARYATLLPWRDADVPGSTLDAPRHRLARAEIVGPEAPLRHPAFHLGFLLMAPWADCTVPGGPAVEVHHIVSGRASWTTGETADERRPGDFILLPSKTPFAVRTDEEPLLTIYIRTEEHPVSACC